MPPAPQRLTVKVERFGPAPSRVNGAANRLARHPAVSERLNGGPSRLLALSLVEPER